MSTTTVTPTKTKEVTYIGVNVKVTYEWYPDCVVTATADHNCALVFKNGDAGAHCLILKEGETRVLPLIHKPTRVDFGVYSETARPHKVGDPPPMTTP